MTPGLFGPWSPPVQAPVTPPLQLPAPAFLMVVPQNSGRQNPNVVSARDGRQNVPEAQGAPVHAGSRSQHADLFK